jgi:hypothetical protein
LGYSQRKSDRITQYRLRAWKVKISERRAPILTVQRKETTPQFVKLTATSVRGSPFISHASTTYLLNILSQNDPGINPICPVKRLKMGQQSVSASYGHAAHRNCPQGQLCHTLTPKTSGPGLNSATAEAGEMYGNWFAFLTEPQSWVPKGTFTQVT